jgi:BirA family biotin operon repressor/biotin-[acetyl-CoA-carboxylase] ligase
VSFTSDDLALLSSHSLVGAIEFHPEIASTNDRALAAAAEGCIAGLPLLVLAGRQSAGRGRGQNSWWAGEGSLAFSLLIDTAARGLPTDRWPQLSLTTGLAICEALAELLPGRAVGLKWPNDVWLLGKKVCGILIEPPPRALERLVVGIGVNVNSSFAAAPEELARIAISLRDAAGSELPLAHVLAALLTHLDACWRELAESPARLAPRWREYDVLLGREVELTRGGQRVAGRAEGLDESGALLLRTAAGLERHFSGSITQIGS